MEGKKENDVIFNDLSISGYHCELLFKNNILYLKDLGSKYGSMKYIRNEYEIQIGNNIELLKKNLFLILIFLALVNIFKIF